MTAAATTAALELRLARLDRASAVSLTQQLVDLFIEAVASGELEPGDKLPPTRRVAELAGVNQLTAGRCYRRLQQAGVVVSEVGRGTFVRAAAASHRNIDDGDGDTSWQAYQLPPERGAELGRLLDQIAQRSDTPDVIALSDGHPPLDMPPVAQLRAAADSAIARRGPRSFGYCPVAGVDDLREELARLGRARGLDDDADSIIVTTGARQALALVARAVLSPGDKVACESPTFVGIRDVLAGVGAEVFAIPVDADGLDTTALEELLRRGDIRMVILQPRLHNPTANDLSAERRERLVELAVQHAFFILEDAVYADIRFAGEELGPLRAQAPAHVIYVDSLSKTVTPGLRFGWIAASGPVFDRLVAEKRRDDGQSATLAQMAIAAFLADGRYPQQLERTLGIYRERRDVIVDALAAHMADLASFSPPNGGGHIWVTLRRACDDEHLYHEALSAGVAFLPGRAMLIEREQATHLRLSYGLVEPAGLREGVRRLAAVVRSLADRLPEGHSLLVN